jgi:hypothetical protein
MKRKRLFIVPAVLFLLLGLSALLVAGCDDNMDAGRVSEVGVESITLNEELSNGITMQEGDTRSIAWKVTLFPENATDRVETFYSSDIDVATVNGKGELTAQSGGTSEITIFAGGKSVSFTLTVIAKVIIPATEINAIVTKVDMMLGINYNLAAMVVVYPYEANDGVSYESSDENVVLVDQDGLLVPVSVGDATITIASKRNPETVNATVPVKVDVFSGDYPRTGWTMSAASQNPLFTNTTDMTTNTLTSALDGDLTTFFGLVIPGKKLSGVEPPSGAAVWFIVDMKQAREINYFRLYNRSSFPGLRWTRFDEISGSNDGEEFTKIAGPVTSQDAAEPSNVPFPKCRYRYVRFFAQDAACFGRNSDSGDRSSKQIGEIYLGLIP